MIWNRGRIERSRSFDRYLARMFLSQTEGKKGAKFSFIEQHSTTEPAHDGCFVDSTGVPERSPRGFRVGDHKYHNCQYSLSI